MCVPMLGAVFGMLGSVVSAAGAMAQANAQADQAAYNAQVAAINARTARQQGLAESDRVSQKYQRDLARMRAGYAKAGVNPATGSASLVINQEGGSNQWLDEMNTIWNRQTEAIGYDNKKKDLEMQAAAARSAGGIGAASSILSGIGGFVKAGGGAGSPLTL